MLKKWGLLLIALAMGILLAMRASNPPAPQGADISPYSFSSSRAMDDVRIIAAAPHPTGSEENAKVRDYLAKRMSALGMEVSVSESLLDARSLARLNKWSGNNKTEQAIFNVIGVLPGIDRSKPAVLLMAHHDTVWGSPGAADDTVGIASIFEIIRALNAAGQPERDLIVLLTDGEELGLTGAVNFFKSHPLRDKIGAVINFEARGGGGTANMFQTSANNGAAARLFAASVRRPSTSSVSTFVYSVLPNDTDLTPALKKDYTAFNIANIGQAKYYHSPKITADTLDEGTLQHMGSQGYDLTSALLAADELPAKTPDATFFDVFGFFTLVYSPFWGWIFLMAAAVFYGVSANLKSSKKGIAEGFLRMAGFFLIGGGLLYGLNKLSGNNGSANYYDRLADLPRLGVMAVFICSAAFFAIFGRKHLSENARLGAAIPIFIIGVLGQVFAPTAAYFITLSLLFCGLTSVLMGRRPDNKMGLAVVTLLSAVVFGYMLGLGHLLVLGVGANILVAVILLAAIAALALLPLYAGLPKRGANIVIVVGLGLALALALWMRLDPMASTIPHY